MDESAIYEADNRRVIGVNTILREYINDIGQKMFSYLCFSQDWAPVLHL